MSEATELAQAAMKAEGGDVLKATKRLERMARKDVAVWQALTEGLLRTACYDACRGVCRSERRQIWYTPNYDAGGNGERVKAHGDSLMDLPLPGGKRLRDATHADLLGANAFYAKQASQMQILANFYLAVAGKVKTKTVGETLTESALRRLKNDAEGSQRDAVESRVVGL